MFYAVLEVSGGLGGRFVLKSSGWGSWRFGDLPPIYALQYATRGNAYRAGRKFGKNGTVRKGDRVRGIAVPS